MEFQRNGHPEICFLPLLVDQHRIAVDVGAADGVYSWHLMRLSSKIVAFEPNPHSFASLRKAMPRLDVRQIALSNEKGTAVLRVPISRNLVLAGWGTIHVGQEFSQVLPEATQSFMVEKARLDDLDLANVGFMKIDVEGHELEVLQGATNLLERDRPNILIEAAGEGRGNDPGSVCMMLRGLGYIPLYLRDGATLAAIDAVPAWLSSVDIIAIPNVATR